MTLGAPYQGLRVLDLSTNIAGPFAALILGDLGADVIKVERPPHGDDTRALPPRWNGESTVFLAMNRNKRSVLLDFKSAEGREILLKLADTADVVIESFPPGLADKLSLRYADFKARNPKIILCTISAFGTGPLGSKMPGYDALVQAASGMMSFTGHPGAPPLRIAPSVLDLSTGLWGTIGTMAALARRAQTGVGEWVTPSLIDSAFTLMCHQLLGFLATGEHPQKLGSGAPSAAPYGVFPARDGDLMIATASEPQFPRLCRALGMETAASDPHFSTMAARLENRERLNALIAEHIVKEPVDHWLTLLGNAGISVCRVNMLDDALNMPVTQERQLFVAPERYHGEGGMPLLRLPIDEDGSFVRRPPPKLGEHTEEILREAGLTAGEMRD